MPEETQEKAPEPQEKATASGGGIRKRHKAAFILIIMIAAGSIIGGKWWVRSKTHVSTDDAFITAHIHQVSSRVTGHVLDVLVEDNQRVSSGDLLVELDPADYEAAVSKASSDLNTAINDDSQDRSKLGSAKANVELAVARLELARKNLERGEDLYKRGVISKQDLDDLETQEKVSEATLSNAKDAVKSAEAAVGLQPGGTRQSSVKEKRAALKQAELALSYTKITAPSDGYVTKKYVEPGNNVQPAQPLLAIVNLDDSWVVANYKESQLEYVRPGQPVEFEVDAYPGHVFRGRVDSIMAGTGAAFSLLPPENATGNFVKIVQRVPVKIVVDRSSDPEHLLRVGMSVVPTIITGRTARDVIHDTIKLIMP
jgi:membrane fusion protein, multidrug efflux system